MAKNRSSRSRHSVQAPKAVKRGKKNNKPRSGNGMQVSGNARALISSSMPRPYKRVRSVSDDTVEVTGMELLSSIASSAGPVGWDFFLNPGNSQFLKQLSAVAFGYEKFRFEKLRLRYWTLSPATRSGIVNGVILLDPLADPPADPQAYMAFAHSLTRPLSLDGASVQHNIKEDKWYYVNSGNTQFNSIDPTTRFQGRVTWQSQGSATDDVGLVSGYIGLEYVCSLKGHRPVRPAVLIAATSGEQKFNGSNINVNYDSLPNVVGAYDLQVEGEGESKDTVPGYTSNYTYTDSFLSYLGKHMINYAFPLGGALDSKGARVDEEKGFVPRPTVSLFRARRGGPWICEVGGAVVDVIPRWVTVNCEGLCEEKSADLVHPVRLSDLSVKESYSLRGNAAGDVTVYTRCGEPDGSTDESIDSTTVSAGTGALTVRRAWLFSESVKNCRLRLAIVPTGTENRTESEAGYISYSEATGDEALA